MKRGRAKARWVLLPVLAMLLMLGSQYIAMGDSTTSVFSTWDVFEVDKLASIWLIKRFINSEAKIKIYHKGDPITEGLPFDTPEAKFRRYYNLSTYEMFLRHYKIDDSRCVYISRIVHDIEINTWEKKVMNESRSVIDAIQQIIDESSTPDEIISRGIRFFDKLYAK